MADSVKKRRYDSARRIVRVDDGTSAYWSAVSVGSTPGGTSPYDALGRLGTSWIDNGAGVHSVAFDPAQLETITLGDIHVPLRHPAWGRRRVTLSHRVEISLDDFAAL